MHRFGQRVIISLRKRAANDVRKYASDASSQFPSAESSLLKNNLKVVSENWATPTSTVGLYLDVGSRYDGDSQAGIAHLFEHMAYKGTAQRTQQDIEMQAMERGAYLYSDTTRESTSLKIRCLNKDVPWAVELLSEIASNTSFDSEVLEKSKRDILVEMSEAENDLRGVVMDYAHAAAYQGTPLAGPIIGQPDTLQSITAANLSSFVSNHFKAPRICLAVAGGLQNAEIADLANQHFSKQSYMYEEGGIPQRQPCRYTGSELRHRDDAYPLAHVALAVEGPAAKDSDCVTFEVAGAINGSWDRQTGGGENNGSPCASAAFNEGLLHSFDYFFEQYHDTSLWGVRYSAERLELQRVSEVMHREWVRFCSELTDFEVQRAKNQLKTEKFLKLQRGGLSAVVDEMGWQMMNYGRRMPTDEYLRRIDKVSAKTVHDTFMEYIFNRCCVIGAFGPIEALHDYTRFRGNMYQMRI